MNRVILPGPRTGKVQIPASKSQAHRMLICAALGDHEILLRCRGLSKDICATIDCLRAIGVDIQSKGESIFLRPIGKPSSSHLLLPCGESGSTLRFLLPLVGVLGIEADFLREGRLPERPIEPMRSELCRHGMTIEENDALLHCRGQLQSGSYFLPGNISSQYISALLMSLPLLPGDSTLHIDGNLESSPYVSMTEQMLLTGGVRFNKSDSDYFIPGGQHFHFPSELTVEGDYSNAAFFLCGGAFSKHGICAGGLNPCSLQGDRKISSLLSQMGAQITYSGDSITVQRGELHGITIDASPIPDLIPILSVVAAAALGDTRIVHAERLRLKESDRLHTTVQMLSALGADAEELPDGLVIHGGKKLRGGTANACGDHRIAMSAAIAAGICSDCVTVCGSECVQKSYPDFWNDFDQLKGDSL